MLIKSFVNIAKLFSCSQKDLHTDGNVPIFQPICIHFKSLQLSYAPGRALTDPINNSFIRDFSNQVLNKTVSNPELELVEIYRSELCKNTRVIETIDLGAGTKSGRQRKTIGSMAKVASVSKHYGKLLYCLAGYYKPDCIIELGTAFGISTMYLALGNPQARVITVEGNPQLAEMAYKNFAANNFNNITLINSTFENAITQLNREINSRTLVFIDGNHTLQATLQYFDLFGENA